MRKTKTKCTYGLIQRRVRDKLLIIWGRFCCCCCSETLLGIICVVIFGAGLEFTHKFNPRLGGNEGKHVKRLGGRNSGEKMKRRRAAVKGNGTVGLTEGREGGKEGLPAKRSVTCWLCNWWAKKQKERRRWPCDCCQSVHTACVLPQFPIHESRLHSNWEKVEPRP